MRKHYFLIIALMLLQAAAHADKGPQTKGLKIAGQGSVHFKFNNIMPAEAHKDSVLIIFDRYNHTGAGVIFKVYAADKNQNIIIEDIPAGKYYVTVRGLGLHRDQVEKIVTIKAQKNEKLNISLEDSEEFTKDNIEIPAYKPNFENMAVLRSR